MRQPVSSDLLVLGIEAHRQVGGQHGWLALLVGVKGVWNDSVGILGHPLRGPGRAVLELPLVVVQRLEEAVAPLCRRLGPDNLEARGDGIATLARSVLANPAESLVLNTRCGRFWSTVAVWSGTVGLAKSVTTDNKSGSLLVVHAHAAKGCANIVGSSNRVRVAVGTGGVDINQTHVCGSKRLFELAILEVCVL